MSGWQTTKLNNSSQLLCFHLSRVSADLLKRTIPWSMAKAQSRKTTGSRLPSPTLIPGLQRSPHSAMLCQGSSTLCTPGYSARPFGKMNPAVQQSTGRRLPRQYGSSITQKTLATHDRIKKMLLSNLSPLACSPQIS